MQMPPQPSQPHMQPPLPSQTMKSTSIESRVASTTPPAGSQQQSTSPTTRNYFDLLPKDVLSHLFIYLKLLGDEERYSLGKTSRSMLSFIQTRYERSGLMKWYLYRLTDFEANHFKLPWTSHEERSQYVLISTIPHPDNDESDQDAAAAAADHSPEQTIEVEWVILRHEIDQAIVFGGGVLPFESFVLNEYQPNRFAIGEITRLNLIKPLDDDINLPHLKFLPSTSLKQLELIDVLINPHEVIQTYRWPPRLESLKLRGFDTRVFTREMLCHWPSALKELILGPDLSGCEYNGDEDASSEIFIPSSVLSLCVEDHLSIDSNSLQLPCGLTELKCPTAESLVGWELPASLKSMHFGHYLNAPVDKWIMPRGLEELTFPPHFRQSIEGTAFSDALTHLNLGGFNCTLIGITFPATLTHLQFGHLFQQTLLGVTLPTGLKTLIYGHWIDRSICHPDFSLPQSITHLQLGRYQPMEDEDDADGRVPVSIHNPTMIQLPQKLQYLQIPLCILSKDSRLPVTLEGLVITNRDHDHKSDYGHLNSILGSIAVLRHFTLRLSVTSLVSPPSLKRVKLEWSLEEPSIHTNTKLKRVIFDGWFDENLAGVKFSDSKIEFIQFDLDEMMLPASLREILVGKGFSQYLFPPGLDVLSFIECRRFHGSLVHAPLPPSVKVIQLHSFYDGSLAGLIIPPNLERFEIGRTDCTTQFTHIDYLIQLKFPPTIKLIRLPNPLRSSFQDHPSLDDYQKWLFQLPRLHPSACIQLSHRWLDDREGHDLDAD